MVDCILAACYFEGLIKGMSPAEHMEGEIDKHEQTCSELVKITSA